MKEVTALRRAYAVLESGNSEAQPLITPPFAS